MAEGSAYGIGAPAGETGAEGVRVAYLGHDAADAAVRRRIRAMEDDGAIVTGLMPRRRDLKDVFWSHLDLGTTGDGQFLQRIRFVLSSARKIARDPGFRDADLIIARNLDMLLAAFNAKRVAGCDTPVVYECLDVHRMLSRPGRVGDGVRALERSFLKRCRALWVSSPGFLANHFEPHHGGLYTAHLLENRLPQAAGYGPRPALRSPVADDPLRVGFVGNLRCERSFQLLLDIATHLGERVEVHLYGQPAETEISNFAARHAAVPNVTYHGRYDGAGALSGVYAGLDVVWAGDFMEAGYNSCWLLPNRLYEGGYFNVPAIAPESTQTAKWITDRGVGFTVAEPLETTLPALVDKLAGDRSALMPKCDALAGLPGEDLVEPRGTVGALIAHALGREVAQ